MAVAVAGAAPGGHDHEFCGAWPTAADAHRARNAAFAPGIGIGADESRAPPSAPSRRHDDGSSGEEGVIALIPRSSVYVARFITARHHILRGVARDADGSRWSRRLASFHPRSIEIFILFTA